MAAQSKKRLKRGKKLLMAKAIASNQMETNEVARRYRAAHGARVDSA
jgi:hypothetical protein